VSLTASKPASRIADSSATVRPLAMRSQPSISFFLRAGVNVGASKNEYGESWMTDRVRNRVRDRFIGQSYGIMERSVCEAF